MKMKAEYCKCCGGVVEFPEGKEAMVCSWCGTWNKLLDERVREREDFKNARELQLRGEFCDAEASYQRVLDDVPDDADALWGRLLCHYGAALVTEEGEQRKYTIRIPRSKPLRAQGDFERACENALPEIRAQYEQDAAYIDTAMARIRELAATKPPYDVFICHKTSNPNGVGYTEDYGRAYDLRNLLVQQGYRVFFAPVEMEGVSAGENYEAGIYHALDTAKVMLVICSDPALVSSTWVASEWQRYLSLRDEGRQVALIPLLYGGMKASALPRAFHVRSLQAIKMELDGKDRLLERLQALIPREKPVEVKRVQPVQPQAPVKKRKALLAWILALCLLATTIFGGKYVYEEVWHGELPEVPQGLIPVEAQTERPTATPTEKPTVTPVPQIVTQGKVIGDYKIDVYSNNTCEITDYTGNETKLSIPQTLGGYRVTSIGDRAFYECPSLTSLTLPEGVTSIGDRAFSHCTSLTSLTLPEGVTSIGEMAFFNCLSLTSLTLPEGVTSIGDTAFGWCTSLTSLTLPEGVTSIGDWAFSHCTSLTSLTLPEGVTSIGEMAFDWCTSLTSLTLPDSVMSIGANPFTLCSALTTIRVSPEHPVLEVADGVLFDKTENKLICYPCTYTAKSYTVPEGVTSIGAWAFDDCNALTSLTLPEGVTSIGAWAFDDCNSLTSLTLPEGVTSIGDYAFYRCNSLTSLTLPDSVMSIGERAFDDCPNLTLRVPRNSYAATYAQENSIKYEYTD